jgi:hypothetical protein
LIVSDKKPAPVARVVNPAPKATSTMELSGLDKQAADLKRQLGIK